MEGRQEGSRDGKGVKGGGSEGRDGGREGDGGKGRQREGGM